jgi:hypothetical protein
MPARTGPCRRGSLLSLQLLRDCKPARTDNADGAAPLADICPLDVAGGHRMNEVAAGAG